MQIVSINAEHTIDKYQVAFNVDAAPIDGVINKISFGNLKVTFENNILKANAPSKSLESINANIVKTINEEIAKAEELVKKELDNDNCKRESMLKELSRSTGLEIA